MLYSIEDFSKLRPISHIIWDVDGPITEKDRLEPSVAAKIINLALDDICHSFITGRDAKWLEDNLIRPMQEYYSFPIARNKFKFYAEVGCIEMELAPNKKEDINWNRHPSIAKHPLLTNKNKIRTALQACVYNPKKSIREYKAGAKIQVSQEVVYDANEKGWLFNAKKKPLCSNYIWGTKEAIVTWEKVRDSDGNYADFNQQAFVKEAKSIIKEKGFEQDIDVEEIGTAINILPIINGRTLGKSWAAGMAIERIWDEELGKKPSRDSVVEKTIAIGDGRADFGFTSPDFGENKVDKRVNFIFVGGEHDMPKPYESDAELKENMVIRATGLGVMQFHYDPINPSISMEPAKGARVVSEVLDFLKLQGYFRSFSSLI